MPQVEHMKYILGITIMVWSFFSSANEYPQVLIAKEDGFVDLTFKIVEEKDDLEFLVKGSIEGTKVGFAIEFLPVWKPQKIEDSEESFYWGEAYFKSIGLESKDFIISLAKLYKSALPEFSISEKIHAQVVGLACNPSNIKKESCKTKFFFNSNGEEDLYSEIYINIDLQSKTLEFNEKDNDYRVPLLRSLSK